MNHRNQSEIVRIRDLKVSIPVGAGTLHAVRGVDLAVQRGETLCIVGESGCGKSLTALSLIGLLPPAAQRRADELSFEGRDLLGMKSADIEDLRGMRIGMIFQDPLTALNPTLTIGRQLEEVHLRHIGAGQAAARQRALELLRLVGINAPEERLRQYPHQLSGGLRQRILISMALMCEPSLLIADEPTTALDVTIQAQVLKLLQSLKAKLGITLILITHDLGVVAAIADRVAVMYAGQVVEQAPVRDIFRSPQHPYTRALLRCVPRFDSSRRGEMLGSIPGRVPSLVGEIEGCAFADRCDHVFDDCRRASIPLVPLTPAIASRCLLARPAEVAHA